MTYGLPSGLLHALRWPLSRDAGLDIVLHNGRGENTNGYRHRGATEETIACANVKPSRESRKCVNLSMV